MQKKGGFTVIELLIVVVVIAVLALITIATYNGVTARAYRNRAEGEMSSIARAVSAFEVLNGRYPADVNRGLPPEVTKLMNGSNDRWPDAPWPDSVYDYDYWVDGDTGDEVVQISIRFCPLGASDLSECNFPNKPWASSFQVDSSYYWCIKGECQAHASRPADYPAKCANCKD